MSEQNGDPGGVDDRTRALILRCLDGVATEAEVASLDALVTKDPAAARELARAAMLESSLEVVSRERSEEAASAPRARPRRSRRWAPWILVAAGLAMSSICAAFILARPWTRAPASGSSAQLSASPPVVPSNKRGSALEPPPVSDPPRAQAAPSASESGFEAARKAARAPDAEDALQTANKLRRQGRWVDAARAYTQIANDYAGTARGSVAALSAASLRLEHLNDPRGALRLYRVALGASDLSAEAELGMADCYHALGDRDGEIAALQRLIGEHPDALSREGAARRLDALRSEKP